MEGTYGLQVVSAENVFKVLEGLGIRRQVPFRPNMGIKEYRRGALTTRQIDEIKQFAPRVEVTFWYNSKVEEVRYFRTVLNRWVCTFVLLPDDLVVVAGEFHQGVEEVILTPPTGAVKKWESPTESAMREFLEETGISLTKIIPLCEPKGLANNTRHSSQIFWSFLGIPEMPISPKPQNLDRTEQLKIVLIPLPEWLKLIERGEVVSAGAIATTFLALRKLGKL